jgi:glycosyltransferase involved in cell wall biosynthesis
MQRFTPEAGRFIAAGARVAAGLAAPLSGEAARQARVLATLADEGQLDLVGFVAAARLKQARERFWRLGLGMVGQAPMPIWQNGGVEKRPGPLALFAVSSFEAGGAEQFDLDAIQALSAAGWNVVVACAGGPSGPFAERFKASSLAWTAFGGLGLSGRDEQRVLEAALDRFRPSLFVIRHVRAAYASAKAAPAYGTVCVDIIHTATPAFGDWIDAARAFASALALRLCSNSIAMRAVAARGGERADVVRLTPVGVETASALPDNAERAAARRRFGIDPLAPVIGTLGRLAPEKDLKRWVAVAAAAARSAPDLRFLIAGEGPMRQSIEAEISRLGLSDRICLPGRVDSAREVYAAIDAFLLTSRFEGLPLSPLEALATGVPVAALAVGAVEEAIAPPFGAVFSPAASADDIAAGAIALLRQTQADPDFRSAALRHVASRFSRQAMQSAFLAACNEALQSSALANQPPFAGKA